VHPTTGLDEKISDGLVVLFEIEILESTEFAVDAVNHCAANFASKM